MVALIIGLLLIVFTVIACLPGVLGWGPDVLAFIRGALPVLSAFIALIAVFIGLADLKDRREARKEEASDKTDKKP